MKKYYSPYAEKAKVKHIYPISKLLRKFMGATRGHGIKVEYKEDLPQTPVIICPNHACDYGPIAMDKVHKRKHRIWSVDTIVKMRTIPKHLLDNVLIVKNKFFRAVLYPFLWLIAAPMSCFIRSQEPIPVYYDARVKKTFDKTAETLNDGMDVVLYPEWKERAEGYKYVNKVKSGVALAAKTFIEKYHKPVNIIPVYVCESLKKVIYGKAILVESITNFRQQANDIVKQIMDQIENIGSSLPKHRITPYDATYRGIDGGRNPCGKVPNPV